MAYSDALSHSLAVSAHKHTSADKEKTPASSKRIISLTDARSVLYIAPRNAFSPAENPPKFLLIISNVLYSTWDSPPRAALLLVLPAV